MISMDKKYKYRNGEPARVLCVDAAGKQPVISLEASGVARYHHTNGRWSNFIHEESKLDLIEVSPWEDFKIDEPVMVRDFETDAWVRRYFAGIASDGRPMAWAGGRTSWNADGDKGARRQCRRPTAEELYG